MNLHSEMVVLESMFRSFTVSKLRVIETIVSHTKCSDCNCIQACRALKEICANIRKQNLFEMSEHQRVVANRNMSKILNAI